jgi:hypothetical protein
MSAATDLRLFIPPAPSTHPVYLTSFLDTTVAGMVKWEPCHAPYIPCFSDYKTGALDAGKFSPKKIYSYTYKVSSQCGARSAKAYVFTSDERIPVNKRDIFVCKDLEASRRINLNRICGMEDNGQWSYPDDKDNIVRNNVVVTSPKYSKARIFNAQKAYSDALRSTAYDVPGKPGNKAFKFKFISSAGVLCEFTLTVGPNE